MVIFKAWGAGLNFAAPAIFPELLSNLVKVQAWCAARQHLLAQLSQALGEGCARGEGGVALV
jgi:hypothetical protein